MTLKSTCGICKPTKKLDIPKIFNDFVSRLDKKPRRKK